MIKDAPYYWVVCDNCGERAEYDDFSAMSDPGQAVDWAISAEWSRQGERHHCPDCPVIADCEECGKDAGELPLERDGLCQSCWDTAEVKAVAQGADVHDVLSAQESGR